LSSKTELYDLEADPAETNNLVAEQPELAAEMEQRMRGILDASLDVAPTVHLDQESVALLASLGYVGGGGGFSSRDQNVYRFPSPKESVGMYRELLKVRQFEDSFPFKTIEGLKGLLVEHPRQLVLYRDLGRLATLAGDEATALDSLAKAAHLKPEDPRLHVFRGLGLHRFGHFEESADELKLALKLDPTNANAWYNLGLVEVSRKRMDAAIVAFERAVEHNDRDILALNNLAFLTLTYRQDADAAWAYIERALAINQTQPLVLANRQLIAAARADLTR
jgi:tetratricopeptide (TPR) repeat protein